MVQKDDLLNLTYLVEDYYRYGFKQEHPEKAEIRHNVNRAAIIRGLSEEIKSCTKCPLSQTRKQAVPGRGPINPLVFVLGDGPDEADDMNGQPFCGPSGQYLDKWLNAVTLNEAQGGLNRHEEVFLTHAVKCLPGTGGPRANELAACRPYLLRQIDYLKPKAVLCLGLTAAQALLGGSPDWEALRGRDLVFNQIPLIITYDPRQVLKDSSLRAPVWADLKRLKTKLTHAGLS